MSSPVIKLPRWTSREDAYLRKVYRVRPVAAIAERLGRTVQSIRKRAQVLGIQTAFWWTAEEESQLRKSWGKVSGVLLARQLGRPYNAVKQKAGKMGLDAERLYTPEEIQLVRDLYPTHTAGEIAKRLHGSAQSATSVYRLANRLGLRKWPSWPPEVIERVRALHAEGLTDMQIVTSASIYYTLVILAVARANWEHVDFGTTGWGTSRRWVFSSWPFRVRGGKRRVELPGASLPIEADRAPTSRAIVPLIPPKLRPAGNLSKYCILWEADWFRPPGDPLLLRHLAGTLYAVLAVWDLTELEQAVLGARISQ
jgi:DNA-binding Lrp family transcriptional regulator